MTDLFDLHDRVILVTGATGTPAERGKLIVQNMPVGRFGEADELHGAVHYLLSDASKFFTEATLVVGGGFSAFSAV